MNCNGFVNSIYLGDRALKRIDIDAWAKTIRLVFDSILIVGESVRQSSWSGDDVEEGGLLLEGVRFFSLSPEGLIPNDLVCDFSLFAHSDGGVELRLSVASVGEDAVSNEVVVKIVADRISMDDHPEIFAEN